MAKFTVGRTTPSRGMDAPKITHTHGNIREDWHDVQDEVGKLIGSDATQGSIVRVRELCRLQEANDIVQEMAKGKSADWYLNAVNQLTLKMKEL